MRCAKQSGAEAITAKVDRREVVTRYGQQ